MSLFEKLQTLVILAAVGLGILLGRVEYIAAHADALITPALMCMLFGLFLGIPLTDLHSGFLNRKFTITSLAINFIWIPIFGWCLGGLFLAETPALRIGYIMLLVTPCTDWYLVFTKLARGNMAVSAAILPLNLIIQVVLLPVYLLLFAGMTGYVDLELLGKSVVLVLVIPFCLGQGIRALFKDDGHPVRRVAAAIFADRQFAFLCLAIVVMFASQATYITGHLDVFYVLLLPVVAFFVLNFVVGRVVARVLNFSYDDSVSLSMTTLARNSPISLAIAITAFPGEPMIALALVIGPLLELPILAIVAQVLLFMRPRSQNIDAAGKIA